MIIKVKDVHTKYGLVSIFHNPESRPWMKRATEFICITVTDKGMYKKGVTVTDELIIHGIIPEMNIWQMIAEFGCYRPR